MAHHYDTSARFESELFPGVSVILRKMSEGRRIELRKLIGEPNSRIRNILREQATLEREPEETRDIGKWMDLQDSFDEIMLTVINPAWVRWGVKQVEGLEVDGRSLGVEDMLDWPSALFNEVLEAVKAEAELQGNERKNSKLASISGSPAQSIPTLSTAPSAEKEVGGETVTVPSISQVN